jgi:cardiolipin synthase A/B
MAYKACSQKVFKEALPCGWDEEALYHCADQYFEELLIAINQAQKTITFESFIFDADPLGMRLCSALAQAALRGVHVRLMVDGIGSSHWHRTFGKLVAHTPLQVRVYHPMPWNLSFQTGSIWHTLSHYLLGLEWVNKRNHRKACVIDSKLAFVGSFNVTVDHLKTVGPNPPWRDSGIRLMGPQVKDISLAFERAWLNFSERAQRSKVRKRLHNFKRHHSLVRLNDTPRLRRIYFKDLCLRLKYAKEKIWITNPYFVPDPKLVFVLSEAAKRGVDVRILLPGVCDMSLFPWINSVAARILLKNGVKIFHFGKRVLHAKIVIIDQWSMLGSSNLNTRSLLHDLEMDIVTYKRETHEALVSQFLTDLAQSEQQFFEVMHQRYWRKNLFFPFLRLIRYWI